MGSVEKYYNYIYTMVHKYCSVYVMYFSAEVVGISLWKGKAIEAIITADGTNCRALASTLQYIINSLVNQLC